MDDESAIATRGGKFAMDALDSLSDLGRFRHLDDLSDFGGLRRLDDAGPRSMFEFDRPGEWRHVDDQLSEPSFSPDNRRIVDSDYEIFGRDPDTGQPLTRQEFEDRYRTPNENGELDWDWPDNEGRLPGSEGFVDPAEVPRMDRIGGDAGSYFTDNDVPMGERGLPPDRLNFDRNQWDIDNSHPDLQDGSVTVERSEVAPAFGQEGGGVQYRFLDDQGNALSQRDLVERGIISDPYSFDLGDAATGAGVTQGAQALEREAEENRNEVGGR